MGHKKQAVHNICETCFILMRDFKLIRQYLTDEAAILVAHVLVSSVLDYCTYLLRSQSSFNKHKVQFIQQTIARIFTKFNTYKRTSPILKQLLWLPVGFRCIFQMATLIYKLLHSGHHGHHGYFGSLLFIHCGRYDIRYNHPGKRFLEVPQFYPSVQKHFDHSFAFDAPIVWNELLDDACSTPSLES